MRTEEDEAFDDLAKKQGSWGGGFKAKQDMAMHKTQDQNICRHYKQWQHCHICDLESQAAELAGIKAILDEYGLQAIDFVADFKAALAQPAQEPVSFPCCGYTDANAIRWNQFNGVVQCHMCGQVYTVAQPAQEQRPWVGLTDEEIAQGNKESWVDRQAFESAVWWASEKLKEKNG